MNEGLFASFEEPECEETDKDKLRSLKAELESYRTTIKAKNAEWSDFVERVKSGQKAARERMSKTRRGADSAVAGGDDEA
eukprot:873027-Pyramimonas_sp.AAC.1